MTDPVLAVAAFNLGQIEKMSAEISGAQMRERIGGIGHTPAWILGHLAVAQGSALRILGQTSPIPQEWREWCGPGSKEEAEPVVTDKAVLVEAIRAGHAAVAANWDKRDPDRLAQPHAVPFLTQTALKTYGELLVHLVTSHESMHIGQLSAWRRQAGMPALF